MSFYLDKLEQYLYKTSDIITIKNAEIDLKNNNISITNIAEDSEDVIHIFSRAKGDKYPNHTHVAIDTRKAKIVFCTCNCRYSYVYK